MLATQLAQRAALPLGTATDRDPVWLGLVDELLVQQEALRRAEQRCPGRTRRQRRSAFSRLLRARLLIDSAKPGSLSVAELARLANYSTSHFSRVFESAFGAAPQQLMLSRRMQYARQLLEASHLAVREVAELIGFRSASAFSRAFRNEFGIAPRELDEQRRWQDKGPCSEHDHITL
ncbi:helix-turn-helix transcriptional regulator [Pseudomarimonas arenosa]|uniref:Helix-turn-helix domain-containing protein n=1 Tax=Pseudomarimonas arenosa TaxID=2774145 RepID=A0AAW3ZVX1_9GAMM|nr:helix-turn-helix domain-containing protein [Pseudomarimonas arenosa]MBD8528176.1 helix-turn-helix domain-containing protein [Pseudomarimonas arenosa]